MPKSLNKYYGLEKGHYLKYSYFSLKTTESYLKNNFCFFDDCYVILISACAVLCEKSKDAPRLNKFKKSISDFEGKKDKDFGSLFSSKKNILCKSVSPLQIW